MNDGSFHSSGPWRLTRQDSFTATISAPGWTSFASVVVRMNGSQMDNVEGIFNARCIAAVPELVAACKAIADGSTDAEELAKNALGKIGELL